MVRHAGAAATQHRPKVKILSTPTMRCEAPGCRHKAGYLFRTGDGPIQALCDVHAGEAAAEHGVPLPKSVAQVLRAHSFVG